MNTKSFSAKFKLSIAMLAIALIAIVPVVALNAQGAGKNIQKGQTQQDTENSGSADNNIGHNPTFTDLAYLACSVPSLEGYRERISITTWDIEMDEETGIPQISGPGATMDLNEFCEQIDNTTSTNERLGQINFRY